MPTIYKNIKSKVENKRKLRKIAPTKVARPANNLPSCTVWPEILTKRESSTERIASEVTPNKSRVKARPKEVLRPWLNSPNTSRTLPDIITLAWSFARLSFISSILWAAACLTWSSVLSINSSQVAQAMRRANAHAVIKE